MVCSAGNDATARPMFPAAFAPWADGAGGVQPEDTVVPIMSVGALNPNGTDALFSNAGPWVRAFAPGAAVMSTMPRVPGRAGTRRPHRGVRVAAASRSTQTTTPSGFALWSGTSFAAPLFAGQVAAELTDGIDPDDDGRTAAVARAWKALSALTDLGP